MGSEEAKLLAGSLGDSKIHTLLIGRACFQTKNCFAFAFAFCLSLALPSDFH